MTAGALALALVPGPPVARAASAENGSPASGSPASVSQRSDPSRDDTRWQVTDLGSGRYDVAWTSPSAFPLTSDRPTITGVVGAAGTALVFGPPTVDDDGRTVRAVVTTDVVPDPADLDVVLSGDRLDEPGLDGVDGLEGPDPAPRGPSEPTSAPRTDVLPVDPGLPGGFATRTSDYTLDPVAVTGMPEPIEMVGHVVEPVADAAAGERPLVLLMHGRHSVCFDPSGTVDYPEGWPCAAPYAEVPSHLGYDYLQQVLASQGYVTVSVRVNGINAQDHRLADGGAGARAALVRKHLDHWVGLAVEHQVDLDQVVLVGHSRGGEGVNRASIQLSTAGPGRPYRIVGQVLLAPTDFASQSAPYVPTVTVLPYCDGDVSDIQGQQFTDTGRDLVDDDTSLKSSVLVMGANHNFFNTEWTPATAVAPASDDWYGDRDGACGRRHPDRLTAAEQRAVGTAYVAGAVALVTGDDSALPLYDGSAATVASVGDADVRAHALGGGRTVRRPGIDATPTLADGAESRLCRGVASYRGGSFGICGRNAKDRITPHWGYPGSPVPTRQFLELGWTTAGATGGLLLEEPLDLSTDRLEVRTIVDPSRGAVDLAVRLTDDEGRTVTVTPDSSTADGHTLAPLLVGDYLTKLWAQPLLVDPAAAGDSIDLSAVVAVDLVGLSDRGRVWLADLSAAPADLAPAPDQRLPRLRIGELRLPEGDRPTSRIARVPFRVLGDLTAPARFVVQSTGQARGARERFAVDLAPGQRRGTIPVAYTANALADYQSRTEIAAWALRGIIHDDYLGRLVVDDDDPTPVLQVRPVKRRVVEGRRIVLRATISAPASYDLPVYGRIVAGPGEDLRGTDVPLEWLEQSASTDRPGRPLHRLYAGTFTRVRSGRLQARLVVPTLRDDRTEGVEALTIRFRHDGRRITRTVKVVDLPR